MDISKLKELSDVSTYNSGLPKQMKKTNNTQAFDSLLKSAMNMINETNSLTNKAENAALDFAMGKTESTHDLAIAQQKALTSIQYTVAVRDAVVEAYKEIMQLQF